MRCDLEKFEGTRTLICRPERSPPITTIQEWINKDNMGILTATPLRFRAGGKEIAAMLSATRRTRSFLLNSRPTDLAGLLP